MSQIVRITAQDGTPVEFFDEILGSGAIKDAYSSPDGSYVAVFYRDTKLNNAITRERLEKIVAMGGKVFTEQGGVYWKQLFNWPESVVEHEGRLGFTTRMFPSQFRFEFGSVDNDMLNIRNGEKVGKWFASASHRSRYLDPRELGDWSSYFRICIRIARAVARLHRSGLAHSDLSYNNILIDPVAGTPYILEVDSIVVPGVYPPDVVGTPDFIAPEVLGTIDLPGGDPNKMLPNRRTDEHAMAVLFYMYLLYRHPLRGGKIWDSDPLKDEELGMGSSALFIEHPTESTNRVNVDNLKPGSLPWGDPSQMPYTVTGPYLKELFDRAFMEGLHNPVKRPIASEWEMALVKTVDLLQPCENPSCLQKWYVFDNTSKPKCPFCGTPYSRPLPVLDLYSSRGGGKFLPDKHRLMVYNQQSLYLWHTNRNISPNEKLTSEQLSPVGDFHFRQGAWLFVNRRLEGAMIIKSDSSKVPLPTNESVELTDGLQILFDPEDGGRLANIQLVLP